MTGTICGYHVAGREGLSGWETLLEKWLSAARLFYEAVPVGKDGSSQVHKDNERLHVSILAGAAWLCGWPAACEFKRAKEGGGHAGRADLWLKPTDGDPYLIEAKFDWDGFRLGKAEGLLQAACNDAGEKQPGDEKEIKCGVAFVCPSFSRSNDDALAKEIGKVIIRLHDLSADAIAWCFPGTERSAPSPGILLAARLCEQQRSDQ